MPVILEWDGVYDDPSNILPLPVPTPNIIIDVMSGGNRAIVSADNGPVQAPWELATGTAWAVVSGSARPSAQQSGIVQKIVIDNGEADGSVQATIGAVPGSSFNGNFNGGGLVFRYVDANNYWAFEWLFGPSMVLKKYVAGVGTVVATIASTIAAGTVLKAVFVGANITAYLDAATVSATDAAHLTATKHGIGARYTSSSANTIKIGRVEIRGHAEI